MLLANTKYTREQILQWHNGFLKDCPKGELDKKVIFFQTDFLIKIQSDIL